MKYYKFYYLVVLLSIFMVSCTRNKGEKSDNLDSSAVTEAQAGFYFVGAKDEVNALYYYHFADQRLDTIWYAKGESIANYSTNENGSSGFFITTTDQEKKGVFPIVKNICLYALDQKTHAVTKIKNFGTGLQYFAYWQDENSIKVIVNTIDVTTASYVQQKSTIISFTGNVLFEDKKTYDLTKDGYPRMPLLPVQLSSSITGASLMSGPRNEIQIKQHNGQNEEIAPASQNHIQQVVWSKNGKYVAIVTSFIHPDNKTLYENKPETSVLYIYNLEQRKMVQTFTGGGFKNMVLINDYLIFDDGFKDKSSVKIFDLQTGSINKEILIKGGCGLKNIPAIPDYEA